MVTLEKLARLAKVSVSTVSRALNDHPSISAPQKKRLWALARKHGYEFRRHMPMSPIGAEGAIVVVTPRVRGRPLPLSHPFFLELLASIGEALGGSGINIEGLFGASVDGRGLIHLCVQDGPAARKALEGAGLSVTDEADAILGEAVAGASDPGTMGMMARQIANAGINVKAAYIATGNRVVMVTDNNAKLMELIANM